jgi:hypothetical protein
LNAQKIVSRKQFFTDEKLIEATLTTDFNKLIAGKKNPVYQPATLALTNLDSTGEIKEAIKVRLRGNFRKDQCSFASMMFDFSDSTGKSRLDNFKELKVVVPCEWGSDDEQWVFREYLVYKMYQLFTEKSFRVRLMRFRFEDNTGSMKPYRQYGFILEDVDDMAKRNKCKEAENKKIMTEETNRQHTTMINIFQYMIGNTDWNVPAKHNIKFIVSRDTPTAKPFLVPYDFDYCGAVNALYAEPAPEIGIAKVTDRKYLGFPRTIEELKAAIVPFLENEEKIYKMIMDFGPMNKKSKDEMKLYIEGFYNEIKTEGSLQKLFIDKARTK